MSARPGKPPVFRGDTPKETQDWLEARHYRAMVAEKHEQDARTAPPEVIERRVNGERVVYHPRARVHLLDRRMKKS